MPSATKRFNSFSIIDTNWSLASGFVSFKTISKIGEYVAAPNPPDTSEPRPDFKRAFLIGAVFDPRRSSSNTPSAMSSSEFVPLPAAQMYAKSDLFSVGSSLEIENFASNSRRASKGVCSTDSNS